MINLFNNQQKAKIQIQNSYKAVNIVLVKVKTKYQKQK